MSALLIFDPPSNLENLTPIKTMKIKLGSELTSAGCEWPKHISFSCGFLLFFFFLGQDHTNTCSSWEETRGFEEPSVNQSLWEAH